VAQAARSGAEEAAGTGHVKGPVKAYPVRRNSSRMTRLSVASSARPICARTVYSS
jgi:hypothetical protein